MTKQTTKLNNFKQKKIKNASYNPLYSSITITRKNPTYEVKYIKLIDIYIYIYMCVCVENFGVSSYVCKSVDEGWRGWINEIFRFLEWVRGKKANADFLFFFFSLRVMLFRTLFLTKISRKGNPPITLLTDVSPIIQSDLFCATNPGLDSLLARVGKIIVMHFSRIVSKVFYFILYFKVT